jgi:hypothetical protein
MMDKRKTSRSRVNTRETRQAKPTILGEGKVTEYYYFKHLCRLICCPAEIDKSNFGRKAIGDFEDKIEQVLKGKGSVVVVFDADVMASNETERRRLQAIKDKYRNNENVLICDSFPSIEYWFLLHYVDTCKSFSSAAVVDELSKHVSGYCKDMEWAKREHWVASLRADGREQAARERAVKYAEDSEQHSEGKAYTNLYKFFDKYPPKKSITYDH